MVDELRTKTTNDMDNVDKIEKIINEKIRFDIGSIFGGNQPLVNSRELAELIANSSNDIQPVIGSLCFKEDFTLDPKCKIQCEKCKEHEGRCNER